MTEDNTKGQSPHDSSILLIMRVHGYGHLVHLFVNSIYVRRDSPIADHARRVLWP